MRWFFVLGALFGGAAAATPPTARFSLDDVMALRTVAEPQVAPDGVWVAYTVETVDLARDRWQSDLWMTRWDGRESVQLTHGPEDEYAPRWSPDGRWLAFLSERGSEEGRVQLWLLDRRGGEARAATSLPGSVEDYAWSPDGARVVLVAGDPDPATVTPEERHEPEAESAPAPLVIDRYYFKEDERGYLDGRRTHLYLLDVASGRVEPLTGGPYDEYLPSWSPDGTRIAFVSKRDGDPDRHDNYDLYVIEARPGAEPRRVTTFHGSDLHPDWESHPAWSPDGRSIAYLQGDDPALVYFGVHTLAVVSAEGGTPRLLTHTLDRNVYQPRWTPDGRAILFLLEDDGSKVLARVPASGGAVERLMGEGRDVADYDVGRDGRIAVLQSTVGRPFEVFAFEGGALRPLSRQNDALLAGRVLADVQPIRFASRDGTEIHGFVTLPPDYRVGERRPALLRIHGGPVAQYSHRFMEEWQLFAAQGYVVVAANPRGSSGRGRDFARAIWADWGGKDVEDVLAAVEYAVARGWADPARLGIGGWSYGGMLTNYVIARDARFRAATSGASIANVLAGFGTDQYVRDYLAELGAPWENLDVWLRVSFPFFHADRITTPTLFLCGEKDFNVPLLASEQMYQALRSRDVPTQLVIYPGQYHTLDRPSYVRDRYQRYLDWYARFLETGGE